MCRSLRAILGAGFLFALAACGTNESDRTTGGAATGAATGATVGLIGGPVGVALGAVIGAGVGATTGGVTKAKDVNLGAPPWSSADQPSNDSRAQDAPNSPSISALPRPTPINARN